MTLTRFQNFAIILALLKELLTLSTLSIKHAFTLIGCVTSRWVNVACTKYLINASILYV